MQIICTSFRQITTTVPHHSVFKGRLLPPNQERQSTEGIEQNNTVKHDNNIWCHRKRSLITPSQKKYHYNVLLPVALPNSGRFSQFFQGQTRQKTCRSHRALSMLLHYLVKYFKPACLSDQRRVFLHHPL